MDNKDVELNIEIKFNEQKTEKKITINSINQVAFEEVIEHCISNFNIDKELKNQIIFTTSDKNGNTIKIENNDDIIKYAKEITDEEYCITMNLKISEKDDNNKNNELEECGDSIDPKECEKKLEEIENEKDKKIKELEEKIEKMKKEHSLEINKAKSEKNVAGEGAVSVRTDNEFFDKKKIEEYIMGILKKEKENFSSEIQKFKTDMITEIKNELQRDNSSNDEFDEVKKDINSLNKNIEENLTTINNIQKDLSLVKDKIEAIEAKENEINNEKDNKKENVGVGEFENIIKYNNDFFFHNMQFMNMHMNACKTYQCENCHVLYQLNECINVDNEKFKQHILVLQNPENNDDDDDNDNKEKENENEINTESNNDNDNDNKEKENEINTESNNDNDNDIKEKENENENENNDLENNATEDNYTLVKNDEKTNIIDDYVNTDDDKGNIEKKKKGRKNKKGGRKNKKDKVNNVIIEDEDEDNKTENKKEENKNEENKNEEKNNVEESEEQFFNELNNKLDQFFFEDDENIKKKKIFNDEYTIIDDISNYLLNTQIDNNKIKDFIEGYLNFAIKTQMEGLEPYAQRQINYRINKIREVANILKENTEKGSYKNNNERINNKNNNSYTRDKKNNYKNNNKYYQKSYYYSFSKRYGKK